MKLHVKEYSIKYSFVIVEAKATDKPTGKVILKYDKHDKYKNSSRISEDEKL